MKIKYEESEFEESEKESCIWSCPEDDDYPHYYTECKNEFYFEDGMEIEDSGFKYCPYCGRLIKEVKYENNI